MSKVTRKRSGLLAHIFSGPVNPGAMVDPTAIDVSDLQRIARQTHVILEIENGFLLVDAESTYDTGRKAQYCATIEDVYRTIIANKARTALGVDEQGYAGEAATYPHTQAGIKAI